MRSTTLRRRATWCVAAAMAASVVAACGSDDEESSSGSTASSANSKSTDILAAAQKAAAAAQNVPDSIGIDKPLSKKPPTGKTIIFLRCSQPVCKGFQDGLGPAAKALGWTVKYQPFTETPEGIQSALSDAIKARPDGIFFTGIDRSVVKRNVAEAEKADVALVSGYEPAPPEGAVIANIADVDRVTATPKSLAAWIAAESGGKANVAVFSINTYPILVATTNALTKELDRICPDCKTKVLNQKVTDVGTKVPSAAVSAVQRDPNIDYLAFAFGDMSIGVPAALKSAGLQDKVKIAGYGVASPSNLAEVEKGAEAAQTAQSMPYGGWRAMDAFARYFVGDDPSPATTAANPAQLFTKSNVGSTGPGWNYSHAKDYQEQFKKLWRVG
jgi:ribose transport system substrate-binding protein